MQPQFTPNCQRKRMAIGAKVLSLHCVASHGKNSLAWLLMWSGVSTITTHTSKAMCSSRLFILVGKLNRMLDFCENKCRTGVLVTSVDTRGHDWEKSGTAGPSALDLGSSGLIQCKCAALSIFHEALLNFDLSRVKADPWPCNVRYGLVENPPGAYRGPGPGPRCTAFVQPECQRAKFSRRGPSMGPSRRDPASLTGAINGFAALNSASASPDRY